jgi:hypothetical protein
MGDVEMRRFRRALEQTQHPAYSHRG